MLDADTKRRIDTARDILVGKVPDPKSQVEQITIALIYKFMDDIDAESEELGGQRSFFAGKFAQYGWARLMRSGLSGHEVLNLYAEAITRMAENPGIPPLFRGIFNNAYLPYRDPETLRAFLKVIDEFVYDHSERLGDAFEYLLSVLGSQGDAGQFRTPRHIIDFIVAVVDPRKDETVLDPACGTAGFLISSYKHILAANTGADGASALAPDEKARLAANFKGYDISPDMVRLSLVNMYLHQFANPQIFEYDTLTSDERWHEYADAILANPPFMSPKGGIRPHSRFSVRSKRSEVLFVDYMAEHLSPTGRAGFIVPEGIIFQSQNAHKQLRKLLVEDYLVAVVSLPAGVFNPYSGVKTSILFLDRTLARQTDRIAFFKVENDGFDLGAQRRPIDENDLPEVQVELSEYLRCLRAGEHLADRRPSKGLIVDKVKIAADEDYNLSGERYRQRAVGTHTHPLASLGEICAINPRKSRLNGLDPNTRVSFVPMVDLNEFSLTFSPDKERLLSEVSSSYTYFEDNDVLLARVTPCFENGKAGIARGLTNRIGFGSSEFLVFRSGEHVLPEWVFYCVTHESFRNSAIAQMTGTGGLQRVPRAYVENFQIPLPPLEVQEEIVAEIEGYQKVIDGARAVIDNYHPHIPIDPVWPRVELGEVLSLEYGKSLKSENRVAGPYPVYGSNGIVGYHNQFLVRDPTIIVGRKGSAGAVNFCELPCFPIDTTFFVQVRDEHQLDIRFCYYQLLTLELNKVNVQSGVPGLNRNDAYRKHIPLPSLETQQAIVTEIEAEQSLVNTNRKLIDRFERKIQSAVARVWGEDVSTQRDAP